MKLCALSIVLFSVMSVQQITGLLNERATRGASDADLWNLGFELYYRHGFSQKEMADRLFQAYKQAEPQNDRQKTLFQKAARFWRGQYEYFDQGVMPQEKTPRPPVSQRHFVPGFYRPSPRLKPTPPEQ
jgi:hypothetical protein